MQDLLNRMALGNPGAAWLRAAAVALVIGVGLRVVFWRIVVAAERWSRNTRTRVDDLVVATLKQTKLFFIIAVAVWGGSLSLALPDRLSAGIWVVFRVAAILQAAVWANAALSHALENYRAKVMAQNPGAVTGMTALGVVIRAILWSVFLLLLLQNLGVQVTALITGLGIGGIAIALAVQNVLGDLLASLSIIFDRPFEVGDFVIVDDLMGTVENVGLKTTRMQSITGEQLVFNNSDLLSSRIRNYKRMRERRILFNVGVVYGTPRDVLEEIPKMIQSAVEGAESTRFDRCHFKEFGDSALIFEAVYYMLVPEYQAFMDVQQSINLELYSDFTARGIEFAFPSQTIYVEGVETP